VSLDDGDCGFGSGYVVLDADEMWMRNVGSIIMYSGDMGVAFDSQGLRVRSWNGRLLLNGEHVVNVLQ
jgi:hypothetical protein